VTADRLEALRQQISEVNQRLLVDLNDRVRLVEQIRALKQERGLPMHDPAREQVMLAELLTANPGPLEPDLVEAIFRSVFAASLAHMERKPG